MGTAIGTNDHGRAAPADVWKLEDAKARFSEVVRRAQSEGPQKVTVRGRETVVVISVEELGRFFPKDADDPAFVPFLESLGLEGIDLERETDHGRDDAL
jgi:prevent-host-death family protein